MTSGTKCILSVSIPTLILGTVMFATHRGHGPTGLARHAGEFPELAFDQIYRPGT
jgi:hypothetical protein